MPSFDVEYEKPHRKNAIYKYDIIHLKDYCSLSFIEFVLIAPMCVA